MPSYESIPDHVAGRPDRLVQPFFQLRCGLAKYLVETTQDRPAKIFAIADDQFFRLPEHACAQPPPAQRCRKQVIHQPARVGNERRAGTIGQPIRILAEFEGRLFGIRPQRDIEYFRRRPSHAIDKRVHLVLAAAKCGVSISSERIHQRFARRLKFGLHGRR